MIRRTLYFLGLIILALSALGVYQYYSILHVGEKAEPCQADVIIVLGAAVWPHGPSPALQARVDYATQLYHEGFADKMIMTGGMGQYPPTEAEAMAVVATALDVRADSIYLEKEARNTRENLKYSQEIMDENGWQTAIIVTDLFHVKRALLIAEELGLSACGAPARNSALYQNKIFKARYTLREVLALARHYFPEKSGTIIQNLPSYIQKPKNM